jgi:serine protease
MKNRSPSKLRLIFGAFLLVTTVFAGRFGSVAAGPSVVAPERQTDLGNPLINQIIIKYRTTVNATEPNGQIKTDKLNALSTAELNALSTAAGQSLTYKRAMSDDAHVLNLPTRISAASVEAIARKLEALPDVEYAEPDYVMRPTLVPNDPSYAAQWHYHGAFGINAPAAWDITTGSATIRVAIIDTGITDHPDLAGRWVGGYDFIADVPTANDGNGRDSDPHDPGDWVTANMCGLGEPAENSSWHGTHVAGTIGAANNNSLGVAGINWVSPIVPIRVLGRCGGFTSDIVDGMRWSAGLTVAGVPANTNPAKILNLSLGGPGACGASYQNAINAINAVGAIVVIAAGNSNANAANHQPGNCNGVVTVAATDRDGNRTFYSNFGTVVEISAPGGETNTNSPSPAPQNGVLSTLNTGLTTPSTASYAYYQGTSMAAPHIAGVLSLMVSLDPTLNFTQSLQILQSTARAFPAGSSCTSSTCGSGIVDAAAALNAVINPGEPTPTATNTSAPGGKATRTPTATRTITPTPTLCPQATPEPLQVEPVTSPTNQTSQVITVRIGNGDSVTVTGESGSFTVTGNFSVSNPALVTVPLLANTTHHLTVSAHVRSTTGPNGCVYGNYTLTTTNDRLGAPLTIVQSTGSVTPTATITPTPIATRSKRTPTPTP